MAGNESPRSADGDAQLDAIYSAFLARLEGEKRTEVLRTVEPQQSALAAVATRCEDEMDVCEQELQLAMQKLEEVQGKLSALESDEQDAPANPVTLEQAREEAKVLLRAAARLGIEKGVLAVRCGARGALVLDCRDPSRFWRVPALEVPVQDPPPPPSY